MATTEIKLEKSDILDKVTESDVLKRVFGIYKSNGLQGHVYGVPDTGRNGLLNAVYVFTKDDVIMDIILPIFSSEKTSTWNFSYNKAVVDALSEDHALTEADVTRLTKAALFFFNDYNGDVDFQTIVNVADWIEHGEKSKKGKGNSVYFWNEKLPNQWGLRTSDIRSELFVKLLPQYTNKKLMEICTEYANRNFRKFNNTQKRGDTTRIKNIARGLYAQIKTYLYLKDQGYDVNMRWNDGDDLGVDITWTTNGMNINLDVKSTQDDVLRISKFRKETDFYAIVQWNRSKPELIGFMNKFAFWQSNILGTEAPAKDEKTGMFSKKLTKKLVKSFLKMDDLFDSLQKYRDTKMKKKSQLFDLG